MIVSSGTRFFAYVLAALIWSTVWAAKPVGLVAEWAFDEGKGDVLHDTSANANHGRISGAEWVKLEKGYALKFDGRAGRVNIPASKSLKFKNMLTIEAWAMPLEIGPGEQGIVGGGPDVTTHCGLTAYKDGRAYFYISAGTNGCKAKIEKEKWNHLAGTFDGKALKIHVNGELKETFKSKHTQVNPAEFYIIGGDDRGCFNGLIDDVRFYNLPLSAEEIRSHYKETLSGRALAAGIAPIPVTPAGPVAGYNFDEGKGNILHDAAGNNNHGTIYGAKWVKRGDGFALQFDGVDDRVDCGAGPSLDIRGAVSVEAWVNVLGASGAEPGIVGKFFESYALTLYKGSCYWYISSGGNACRTRIEQERWHHVVGTFDGSTMKLYLDGRVVNTWASRYKAINPGKNLLMGCIVGDPDAEDPNLTRTAHFNGMLDDVRIFDRSLAAKEVQASFRRSAAGYDLDTTWFGRLRLTPYCYFHRGEVVVDVDFTGLQPIGPAAAVEACLMQVGKEKALSVQEKRDLPETGQFDMTFSTGELAAGDYEITAQLKDDKGVQSVEKLAFRFPPPKAAIASPDTKVVAPLPSAPGPASYEFELCRGGGFKLKVGGKAYSFESAFSYPHGGENRLLAAAATDTSGERSWIVTAKKTGHKTYRALACGRHYQIERQIRLHPSHIALKDTITNLTRGDLGIILSHQFKPQAGEFTAAWLGGIKGGGKRDAVHNPTAFVAAKGHGFGLLVRDDVLIVQGKVFADKYRAGISDDMFGLGPGKSYTFEWDLYPYGSEDYYDFLNQVRSDLGLNGKRLIGGHAGSGMSPPKEELVRRLGAGVAIVGLMQRIPDDKGLSIEGVEFMHYPKFVAALRKVCEETRKKYPGIKCCLHIAHSLYTTNNPDQFADSKLIDKKGRHVVWSHDPKYMARFFSKKNLDAGWDWYIFYPALDNSFHKEMMRAVDALFDDVGADGVFADGLMAGYRGRFTYDRWDGHTVEIDPETKTIRRKFGAVQLLSQDALIRYCNKIHERGGIVLVDSGPGTLTFALNAPAAAYPVEGGGHGAAAMTHLAPFPMGYGYPEPRDHLGVYRDVLATLELGGLYYYYFGEVEHETVLTQMFPITIQEIHAGCVKGKEKFVTMRSGVYGWPGDRRLHWVHLTDARGVAVPHSFLTTVDRASVRTEIALKKHESAVLKKIPITLRSSKPVNLTVQQYDAKAIRILLNGKGKATLQIRTGSFETEPAAIYRIKGAIVDTAKADAMGTLSVPLTLHGQVEVQIRKGK